MSGSGRRGAFSRASARIMMVLRRLPLLVVVVCVSAACSLGCKKTFYKVDADVDVSSWVTLKHPTYPISARLPKGWVGEVERDKIMWVDRWHLHPPGRDGAPSVWVTMAWLPRSSQHQAGFPGGRWGDEVDAKRPVAGKIRPVMVYADGARMRGDFDSAELAFTFVGAADATAEPAVISKIVELLAVDDRVKPPASSRPAKRALDLARDYAKKKGWDDAGIFFECTCAVPETFRFTIFHARALTSVAVDNAKGSVAESHDGDPTWPKCAGSPAASPP